MPDQPLFKFGLWPINDVVPWGEEGQKKLHWFGLTDGWYTLDCGGVELMRCSEAIIRAKPDWYSRTPYFDYQVARLYEDMLDLLPAAIDPIPSDLLDLVRTSEQEQRFGEYVRQYRDRFWPPPPSASAEERAHADQQWTLWCNASEWWTYPFLSGLHLPGQPAIRIWSEADTLHIRWTNHCGVEESTGLPWSEVADGQISMPTEQFIAEVRSFHDRLMAAMAERIEIARTAWPLPDVSIDVDQLVAEHAERVQSLDRAMDAVVTQRRDWEAIRRSVRQVMDMVDQEE